MATFDLRNEVNITSEEFEYGVDEFSRAELEKLSSRLVKPLSQRESPVHRFTSNVGIRRPSESRAIRSSEQSTLCWVEKKPGSLERSPTGLKGVIAYTSNHMRPKKLSLVLDAFNVTS